MNTDEAAQILTEMRATWPTLDMDDAIVAVWTQTLAPWRIELARRALRRLREATSFMPSHKEFLEAARAEARTEAAERALQSAQKVCPECGGDLMVATTESRKVSRPCSRCRHVQYVRWREGHYNSGHSCRDCRTFAHGSKTDRVELEEAYEKRWQPAALAEEFF